MNLKVPEAPLECSYMRYVRGDVTDLDRFESQSFDIAFSNSVIEHLANLEAQQQMVREMKRMGKGYYLQTPNYWFPIEVHFVLPFFQFLPRASRIWFLTHVGCGASGGGWQRYEPTVAAQCVDDVRLLTRGELSRLLGPSDQVLTERFLAFPKSLVCCSPAPTAEG